MEGIHLIIRDFCQGEYNCDLPDEVWNPVFKEIANNHKKLSFVKDKVHTLWTVNGGHLRRKIKDDELVAKVLKVSLPGYDGQGLILYRGECRFLYESNQIGFCWTPEIDVASKFASGLNSIESGGVLLKAYAPSSAILAPPNDHRAKQMQEYEYTCNPSLLERVELVNTYEKIYS